MTPVKSITALSIIILTSLSGARQGSISSGQAAIPKNVQLRGDQMQAKLVPTAKAKIQVASDQFLKSSTGDLKEARQTVFNAFPGAFAKAKESDIDAIAFLVMMQAAKDMDSDLKEIMNSVKAINDEKSRLRDRIAALKGKQSGVTAGIQDDSKTQTGVKNGIQDDSKTQSGVKAGIQDDSRNLIILKKKFPVTSVETKHLKVRLPVIVPEGPTSKSKIDTSNLIKYYQMKMDTLGDLSQEMSMKLQIYQDRLNKFMRTLANMMKKISDTDSAIIANLK